MGVLLEGAADFLGCRIKLYNLRFQVGQAVDQGVMGRLDGAGAFVADAARRYE